MNSTTACRSWNGGSGDEIVISGIADRFPNSDDISLKRKTF